MISAINNILPIPLKSLLVVIANIDIPPNATEVIKKACATIEAPPGILNTLLKSGVIVSPLTNVNPNNTARLSLVYLLLHTIQKATQIQV